MSRNEWAFALLLSAVLWMPLAPYIALWMVQR